MSKDDLGYYRKSGDDLELLNIKIVDDDGEEFDIETLRSIFKETVENKKESLMKVTDLGCAILGDHYKGVYFMMGFVLNKILNTFEVKNDTKLHIKTNTEIIDTDEIKEKTIEMFEQTVEDLKSGKLDISDIPLNFSNINTDYE